MVPERRDQSREETDEHARHRDPLAVRTELVEGGEAVGVVVGMVGDLEAHHARQGFEMVPDMAARDRAAGDPNEPVMLEIVEALDPEARADHAGKNDRHRGPAPDQEDEAIERKSVVTGKRVSVRDDSGGSGMLK